MKENNRIDVGAYVITPNGVGCVIKIIEDIHPSINVKFNDGSIKNFLHPSVKIINGNLEFVYLVKTII